MSFINGLYCWSLLFVCREVEVEVEVVMVVGRVEKGLSFFRRVMT